MTGLQYLHKEALQMQNLNIKVLTEAILQVIVTQGWLQGRHITIAGSLTELIPVHSGTMVQSITVEVLIT